MSLAGSTRMWLLGKVDTCFRKGGNLLEDRQERGTPRPAMRISFPFVPRFGSSYTKNYANNFSKIMNQGVSEDKWVLGNWSWVTDLSFSEDWYVFEICIDVLIYGANKNQNQWNIDLFFCEQHNETLNAIGFEYWITIISHCCNVDKRANWKHSSASLFLWNSANTASSFLKGAFSLKPFTNCSSLPKNKFFISLSIWLSFKTFWLNWILFPLLQFSDRLPFRFIAARHLIPSLLQTNSQI